MSPLEKHFEKFFELDSFCELHNVKLVNKELRNLKTYITNLIK